MPILVNTGSVMTGNDDGYGLVYRVIDDLNASAVPKPGLRGAMFNAIDRLRAVSAPVDHVAIAERISATIHVLEWSLQRRDDARHGAATQALGALREAWLSLPVPRN
ncbi:hypothetical protein [Novosphingobium sp.]|uniref:hypothetical protein n=1 Tax=Novosphingobium sp. TaxID=1874826 RepID=UPI00334189C2